MWKTVNHMKSHTNVHVIAYTSSPFKQGPSLTESSNNLHDWKASRAPQSTNRNVGRHGSVNMINCDIGFHEAKPLWKIQIMLYKCFTRLGIVLSIHINVFSHRFFVLAKLKRWHKRRSSKFTQIKLSASNPQIYQSNHMQHHVKS